MAHKLHFYGKSGYPFTFEDSVGDNNVPIHNSSIIIDPLSVSLFDCEQIFILEEIDGEYYFPQLDMADTLYIKWNDTEKDSPFFTFDVLNDDVTNKPFIQKIQSPKYPNLDNAYDIGYEDVPTRFGSRYAGKIPCQINIAFSPKAEVKYERTLNIYLKRHGLLIEQWSFYFYGEGIEEDDRFKIHLQNFGIKFNRTDALCLKDYDVTEAMPDWVDVNNARKALFINKEEIFPYVGTYYGLKNLLNVLGYSDELQVREYWEDISDDSMYRGKYVITSISDMLDDGVIQNSSLLDTNKELKLSDYYRKTGFLALCYEFNRPSGDYDENECPIMERTTEFSSSEIFFKLQGLKKMLQSDFLPVNVSIKDLIGEYTYYISFAKLVWVDKLDLETVGLNDHIQIKVFPDDSKTYIRNLYKFHKVEYESDDDKKYFAFPNVSLATDYLDRMFSDDKEKRKEFHDMIPSVIPNIEGNVLNDELIDYYNNIIYDFYTYDLDDPRAIYTDLNDSNEDFEDIMNESLTEKKISKFRNHSTIGCPVVLTADIEELRLSDFLNTTSNDYIDREYKSGEDKPLVHFGSTLGDVKYKDYYEIEWMIKYVGYPEDKGGEYRTEKFTFSYRTDIHKGTSLPIFLPYEGYYDVCLMLYSLTGNVSKTYDNRRIEVKTFRPEIIACYTGDDKFNFSVDSLHNVSLGDFNNTTANNPCVNVLFMDDDKNTNCNIPRDLYDSSVISWFTGDTEIFNYDTNEWENIKNSKHKLIDRIGFGEGDVLRVEDFKNARLLDLFHLKPTDCVLSRDNIPGVQIDGKYISKCMKLRIGYTGDDTNIEDDGPALGYKEIIILDDFNDLNDLCNKLNNPDPTVYSDDDIMLLSLFEFYSTYCEQIGNDCIMMIGKQGNIDTFQYITILDSNENEVYRGYTFDAPRHGFYRDHPSDKLNPLLSLNIDYNDIMNGSANDPMYMIEHDYFRYMENHKTYISDYEKETVNDDGSVNENTYNIRFKGTLPVIFNNNYINLSTTKFSKGSFVIPRFKYVIFFVDNLHRQTEFEWNLTDDTGKQIILTRNNPYFIWRFEDKGIYHISYWSKDAQGNDYYNDRFGMITVTEADEYKTFVEHKLNERKAQTK